MLLVERLGLQHVILLQPRDRPAEGSRTDQPPDAKIRLVAENCGCHQEQPKPCRAQRSRLVHRRKRAQRKQERIAGQERRDHQTRLAEDDREQNRVDPNVVLSDELSEMAVKVQNEVDEMSDEFHWGSTDSNAG